MRKLIMFNMITVDGFFEGPDREIDWHKVDGEFNAFAIEQLDSAGAILFGRITYELMAAYWPTEQALTDDPDVAERMNSIPKYIVSGTLKNVEWNNTELISENVTEAINRLKGFEGKDIFILGSGNLVSYLAKLKMIDEYRLMINPVVLGRGNPLFKDQDSGITLKLIKTRSFKSGNVLLFYKLR